MKSKERREEPLGTMSYQTISKQSPPFWLLIGARKLVFFWHQSEARTAATVWNWSGKTLSPGALLAVLYFSSFHIILYFPAHLDFPSPPLSAPGSPRMSFYQFLYGQTTDTRLLLQTVCFVPAERKHLKALTFSLNLPHITWTPRQYEHFLRPSVSALMCFGHHFTVTSFLDFLLTMVREN